MFKETFLSHRPSQFQINRLVKNFITSEILVWSSWNCAMPIIAVFATDQIEGSDVAIAATGLSVHLMAASAAIGGVIAKNYGFYVLFWIAALVNILGIMPYFFYARGRLTKLILGKELEKGLVNNVLLKEDK